MKVMLIANYLPDRQESMLRFARMLVDGLAAHGIQPILVSPEPRLTRRTAYRYSGWRKYLGYVDKFLLFPRHLRREITRHRPAVIHILDHSNSAYVNAALGVPTLITCHDLLQIRAALGEIEQQQLGWTGRCFQKWILRHLARVPTIVCTSRKTGEDLHRLIPHSVSRTETILNGLNYPYAPLPREIARKRLRSLSSDDLVETNRGFFLNVGGGQWYKNRPGLLRIFAGLRRALDPSPKLVMVGKPLSESDAALAEELGITGALHHFSDVSNENLAAFYSLARGLIFPSWEEGFGWPVAEAQACGCPVFTSDREPMTEVGGDAATYFNPADPEEAVSRIVAAQSNDATLRARGLARSEQWAAATMLASYAALYRRLASVSP